MTRKKILIVAFLIVAAFLLGREMRYPDSWNEVQVGMAETEARELVGRPDHPRRGIKVDIFVKNGLLGMHLMRVVFYEGRVRSVVIERRLGTGRTFYRTLLRAEW